MNQKTVERVAHRDATALGVLHDTGGLLQVGILVHIAVHHSGTRLNDTDGGILPDVIDKTARTAWDEYIHQPSGVQQFCRCLSCGGQQSDGVGSKTVLLQHIVQQTHDSLTALLGIAASFEDAGTAGFQTECCHVDGDIGASLVDDTYHTERHTHALQIESVGERALLEDASQRGRKCCHLACVGCNTFQTLLIEQETVVHRVCLVHAREVDSTCIGIAHKGVRLPKVKKDSQVTVGKIQGEPMLAGKPLVTSGSILDQHADGETIAHAHSS